MKMKTSEIASDRKKVLAQKKEVFLLIKKVLHLT